MNTRLKPTIRLEDVLSNLFTDCDDLSLYYIHKGLKYFPLLDCISYCNSFNTIETKFSRPEVNSPKPKCNI